MRKRLLKDSFAYGMANAIQKLGPFVIVPVITGYLGPDAFKIYDISFVSAFLFVPLIILGQDAAASVLYFNRKPEMFDSRSVVTGALVLQLCTLVVFLCLAFPFTSLWASLLFSQDAVMATWWKTALFVLPGQMLLNYSLNVLLWQSRKKAYLFLCLGQTFVGVGTVLACLLFFRIGLAAVFGAVIASVSLAGFTGLFLIRNSLTSILPSLELALLKRLLWLGLPFAVISFLQLLLPSVDRFFLLHYNLGSQLAPYALAAKIGALMSFASGAFVMAFTPYSLAKVNDDNAETEISALFRTVSVTGFLAVPVLLLFKDFLVGLFADASYQTAAKLLPFFFFGWVFDAFVVFTLLGVYRSQKTFLSLFLFATGFALITMLNILLIPVLGLYGSALSFALCKALVFFISLFLFKKHFYLRIHAQSFWPAFLTAVVCSYLIYVLPLMANIFICAALILAAVYLASRNNSVFHR